MLSVMAHGDTEQAGTIVEMRCQRGQPVSAGDTLLVLRTRGPLTA